MFPANPTGLGSNKSIDCAANLTRIDVHEIILQTAVFGMARLRAFAAGACARRLFIVIRLVLLKPKQTQAAAFFGRAFTGGFDTSP
jgi:hypothetical protein